MEKCFPKFFFIILSLNVSIICAGLQVKYKKNYDIDVESITTPINKPHIPQNSDKDVYSFSGLKKVESIPVLFPIDICLMQIEKVRYAACLHRSKSGETRFVIYRKSNGEYELIANSTAPLAIAMDCKDFQSKGYVALGYNISDPIIHANNGSPIYEISKNHIRPVQYFSTVNLTSVYLRSDGKTLYLFQTIANPKGIFKIICPFFVWSGSSFHKIKDGIPCSNAKRLEPFSIEYENYVAVANYADQYGRTATNSEIFKFNKDEGKLYLVQKIRTNGAVDVKYFSVPFDNHSRKHFLIFGNSINSDSAEISNTNETRHTTKEANSVCYILENDQFVPHQRLSLYDVEEFLPIQNTELEKLILLVACRNQEIKIFNFNDWKFQESSTQFTGGALSEGVSRIRSYEENNTNYLIVSNVRMQANRTNIFLPIFKREDNANELRKQIIEWAKSAIERLSHIDIEKLKIETETAIQNLEKNEANMNIEPISKSNITKVITNSLTYHRLNFTASYWKALSTAQQAINDLKTQFIKKERESSYLAHHYNRVKVGTLVVRSKLNMTKINEMNLKNIQLKSVKAPKIIINELQGHRERTFEQTENVELFTDTLQAEELKVTGLVNEYQWHSIINDTLKKFGNQTFMVPTNITALQLDAMIVANHSISSLSLDNLVRIDSGNYTIDQDIQFADHIYVKKLFINQRLNDIHVIDNNKLAVLLLETNETQIVTGPKIFDNLKIIEPVNIAGKLMGAYFEDIAPIKIFHDKITINGNYTITGDVHIRNKFSASDMIARNQLSTKYIIKHGLRVDTRIEGVNLNFEQPINANDSKVTFINGYDMQQLVRTNYNEPQVIEGRKTFKNANLSISNGLAEAKIINGINIETLQTQFLTKSGNQTIKGRMFIKNATANKIESPSIKLNKEDLSQFLHKSGDQENKGQLIVNKLTTKSGVFRKLSQMKGKISKEILSLDIFQVNNFPGTINVKRMKVKNDINGKSIEDIERLFTQLSGNIKYVGGINFNHDMTISNVTFNGKFNGISANDFGKCWLRKDTDQVFTAPQTVLGIACENGINIHDHINSRKMEDFIQKAYWINRNETFEGAVFEEPVEIKGNLFTSNVNGLRVPEDMLIFQTDEPQNFQTNLSTYGDVFISGEIINSTEINGVNLRKLDRFLRDSTADILLVQHALFANEPLYKKLNEHKINEMFETVWFINSDIELQQPVEIDDSYFEGHLNGFVNDVNIKFLEKNYFSLSKPQLISVPINFSNKVKFGSDFYSNDMEMPESIEDKISQSQFDFVEFTRKTLQNSVQLQEVTEQWYIANGVIKGNLSNVYLNDLKLSRDVVRTDGFKNTIAARKYIRSASIEMLQCEQANCHLNNMNISSWVRHIVLRNQNYTIVGRVTIDAATFERNLEVLGKVNNISFNGNTLLLTNREQVIGGNVHIKTDIPKRTIIVNLNSSVINGLNMERFFENQARIGSTNIVRGNLIFNKTLQIAECDDSAKQSLDKLQLPKLRSTEISGDYDRRVTRKLTQSDPSYYISQFKLKQIMPMHAKDIFYLNIHQEENSVDIIGVLAKDGESPIQYFRWDTIVQQFVPQEESSHLPKSQTNIDIYQFLAHKPKEIDERSDNLIQEIIQYKRNNSVQIEFLSTNNNRCLILYSRTTSLIQVYCFTNEKHREFVQKKIFYQEGIQKIASIDNERIAILFHNSVEIWNFTIGESENQRISLSEPYEMAALVTTKGTFLAICTQSKVKSVVHGSILVYQSVKSSQFEYYENITLTYSSHVKFIEIQDSHDILLLVLSKNLAQLSIFGYKGVFKFNQLFAMPSVSAGEAIVPIHLNTSGQHLIAVITSHEVTFLEVVLKSI